MHVHPRDLRGDAVLATPSGPGLNVVRTRHFAAVPGLFERSGVLLAWSEVHVSRSLEGNGAVIAFASVQIHPRAFKHEIHIRVREIVRAVPEVEAHAAAPDLASKIRERPRLFRVAPQAQLAVDATGGDVDRQTWNGPLDNCRARVVQLHANFQIREARVANGARLLRFTVPHGSGVIRWKKTQETTDVPAVLAPRDFFRQRPLFRRGALRAKMPRQSVALHRHRSLARRYSAAHGIHLHVELQPTAGTDVHGAVHAFQQPRVWVAR